jgi:hypothetical protein
MEEEGYAHRVSVGRCAEREKFTIKDVYGYMSFSFAMAQKQIR